MTVTFMVLVPLVFVVTWDVVTSILVEIALRKSLQNIFKKDYRAADTALRCAEKRYRFALFGADGYRSRINDLHDWLERAERLDVYQDRVEPHRR